MEPRRETQERQPSRAGLFGGLPGETTAVGEDRDIRARMAEAYAKPSGLIISGISAMTRKRHFDSIRIAAGLIPSRDEDAPKIDRVWDQDIMRHSFASDWLARHKNAPELAEITGNTVPIIRKRYENTVLESMSGPYWTIQPN